MKYKKIILMTFFFQTFSMLSMNDDVGNKKSKIDLEKFIANQMKHVNDQKVLNSLDIPSMEEEKCNLALIMETIKELHLLNDFGTKLIVSLSEKGRNKLDSDLIQIHSDLNKNNYDSFVKTKNNEFFGKYYINN